jgi:exodeoxyribonuclease VII large subunit
MSVDLSDEQLSNGGFVSDSDEITTKHQSSSKSIKSSKSTKSSNSGVADLVIKVKNDNRIIYTISEFSQLIENTLKNNLGSEYFLEGEVSNVRLSNHHLFFTVKDNAASVDCVIWRFSLTKSFAGLKIEPGNFVQLKGRINIFAKGSKYSVVVSTINVKNQEGQLHKEYEKLRLKYLSLGYFKHENKKCLPEWVSKVGLLTAIDSAAVKDFLYVLENNTCPVQVDIYNSLVQGSKCPEDVSNNLKIMDKKGYDVICVIRGGGSFEDLFGFSDPLIIETIYACKTPIITGVGHETDTMLCDYVSDIRCPTPSLAAQQIITHIGQQITQINSRLENAFLSIEDELNKATFLLQTFKTKIALHNPEKVQHDIMNSLNHRISNMQMSLLNQVENSRHMCESYNYRLKELVPKICVTENNVIINEVSQLKKNGVYNLVINGQSVRIKVL